MGVYPRRAGKGAGGSPLLLNDVGAGNRLGIAPIGGMTVDHPYVEHAFYLHRTDFGALSTAGAFIKFDVSSFLSDGDLKVPRIPFDFVYFSIGDGLYVEVSSGLHQPGGYYTHSAVVGGEGLVELSHHPTNIAFLLQQVDLEAGVAQVEGGLHAADPTSHHQHRSYFFLLVTHISEKPLYYLWLSPQGAGSQFFNFFHHSLGELHKPMRHIGSEVTDSYPLLLQPQLGEELSGVFHPFAGS